MIDQNYLITAEGGVAGSTPRHGGEAARLASMLPADNHVHSEWSYDTDERASMLAACARAVELGVPSVAFTEHVDAERWEPGDGLDGRDLAWQPWDRMRPLDVAGYLAGIAECRDRFDGLRILTGIEAGEPHLFRSTASLVLASAHFDRVLGSLHLLPLDGELVEGGSAMRRHGAHRAGEMMRLYLGELARLVEGSDVFEVLAHLDYPRRYWPQHLEPYREQDYEEEYRYVLRSLAASGRVLEINTASPLSSVELMRWWRDVGGRAVSFGSDAHVPWRVGDRFELAMDVVEAAGFSAGAGPFEYWTR
jgi:histidinol-phosphatase (PHP family)